MHVNMMQLKLSSNYLKYLSIHHQYKRKNLNAQLYDKNNL